jgi:hypothetical protein
MPTIAWALCVLLGLSIPCGAAEAIVEMELATDNGLPVNTTQEWYRLLVDLKVGNLRIHSAPNAQEPSIKVLGTAGSPVYHVYARLTSRGELLVPGGRFSVRDASKLSQWLTNLKANGPQNSATKNAGPFGLSREQLAQAHAALAQPLGFATRGLPCAKAIAQLRLRIKLPLTFETPGNEGAAGQEPITEELQSLSCGTALAYLLRAAGLGLAPRLGAQGKLELVVRRAGRDAEVWPVGWPPGAARPLPALFEFITTAIDDVTLAEALAAIEERLAAPVLFDRYALVRFGIDPAAVRVTLPETKTSYAQILTKLLSKAQLRYELRIDEAGKPLLWVTTMRRAD